MDADARPDASRGPPATSATASDRVPSSNPSDGATKWQARRRRRRDRRRARLAEEALDHDPDDEDHWRETARRHAREAVRREVRRGMLAPWSDDGVGGLRIIIDLGMESLMNDAELKSLVTQVQLSYAAVLRRTVDEIIRRAQPRPSTDPKFTDADLRDYRSTFSPPASFPPLNDAIFRAGNTPLSASSQSPPLSPARHNASTV